MKKKFYITTAIAYASRKPHAGNTYDVVFADAIARYKRLRGYDVHFVTGTDEHGQKIETYAKEAGITPKAYVDKVSGEIRQIWDMMNTTYDTFIRTTDDYHEAAVQKIFRKLYEQGDIYKSEYEGMYCVPCESFFTETQLVDGKCPDCGREVKPAKEEAYFFRMSKYQDRLMQYIEEHPEFINPKSRENEMVNNFLKPGLQDLCVSRTSFQWGIPVDFDPKHVVYVWLDALTNYITALGYTPDGESELFQKYWPADLHVIGKDILRFHTIYWPCMLMALGLPLPKQIIGHPWFLSGDDKMSKSKGNVVYADLLCELFGVDAVRYYMLANMPYAQDGVITYQNVFHCYNTDLANTIGNLVNRTVSMIRKYFDGTILPPGTEEPVDGELKAAAMQAVQIYTEKMDAFKCADAVDAMIELARRCNKYVDETAPWVLGKTEETKPRLQTVLYNLAEGIRILAVLLKPIMPETADEILKQLGTDCADYDSIGSFGGLKVGGQVGNPQPLFARLEEEKVMADIAARTAVPEEKTEEKAAVPPVGTMIAIDDFAKVDLRVAEVTACEKIEKAKKLLKLQLDDGMGGRQVVSGIAQWYQPEELIGKKIVVVANLKPAKLCGVESQGMILAADCADNDVQVIFVDRNMPNGSKIR